MNFRRICLLFSGLSLGAILGACGTTVSGKVVKPDGSSLDNSNVIVYTSPRTESVKVNKAGAFVLKSNIVEGNEYTLIAEDNDGNMGYVRSFKPKKGANENILLRLSREVDAKEAVLEGGLPSHTPSGIGEKIFKSSP